MKFSVRDGMISAKSLSDKLSLLERIGYDGIELTGREDISGKIEEIKRIIPSYKLHVSTLSGYVGDLLSPNVADRELAISDIKRRLSWASQLGARGLIVVPTFGPAKIPDLTPLASSRELELSLLVDELKDLSKTANNYGVKIILEPLNRYETHLINTLSDAYKVSERAGEGVTIMADFFHMNIEEQDMAKAIRENFSRIYHVHLADSNRLEPGAGHTDFAPGIKVLLELGYNGYLTLECGFSKDQETSLRDALRFVKGLVRRWQTSAAFLKRPLIGHRVKANMPGSKPCQHDTYIPLFTKFALDPSVKALDAVDLDRTDKKTEMAL